MIDKNETFKGTWPFLAQFSNASGFKQHFIDVGQSNGEVLLCLHGEPTWGYVYRKMIPKLAKNYRVIVPDHMGFGKSETPQDRLYTLESHVENLTRLIEDLNLKNITFVAQDWGGPIAGAYALKYPDNVARFCFLNTLLGYGGKLPREDLSPWFEWVSKNKKDGTLPGLLGELKSSFLSIVQIIGLEQLNDRDQNWLNAYSSAFPDRASCIGAIEFPLDIYLRRCIPFIVERLKLGNLSKLKAKPAMLAEGMRDRAIHPENAISDFKLLWPNGPVSEIEMAGHFCQEDCPEILVALIEQFINMTLLENKSY